MCTAIIEVLNDSTAIIKIDHSSLLRISVITFHCGELIDAFTMVYVLNDITHRTGTPSGLIPQNLDKV